MNNCLWLADFRDAGACRFIQKLTQSWCSCRYVRGVERQSRSIRIIPDDDQAVATQSIGLYGGEDDGGGRCDHQHHDHPHEAPIRINRPQSAYFFLHEPFSPSGVAELGAIAIPVEPEMNLAIGRWPVPQVPVELSVGIVYPICHDVTIVIGKAVSTVVLFAVDMS